MKLNKTIMTLSLVVGTLLHAEVKHDPVTKVEAQGKITSIKQDNGSTYATLTQDGKYAQSKFQILFLDEEASAFREKDIILGQTISLKGWLVQTPALKKFFSKKSRKLNTKIQYTILVKGKFKTTTTKEEKKELREQNQAIDQAKVIARRNQDAQSEYEKKMKPKEMSPEEAYHQNMQKNKLK